MMDPIVLDPTPIIEWLQTPVGSTSLNVGAVLAILIVFYLLATEGGKRI